METSLKVGSQITATDYTTALFSVKRRKRSIRTIVLSKDVTQLASCAECVSQIFVTSITQKTVTPITFLA